MLDEGAEGAESGCSDVGILVVGKRKKSVR
jgi:hypothetical protein